MPDNPLRSDSATAPAVATGSEPTRRRGLALSPSRAGDYRQCPLKYRLRAIDKLPEPSTLAQVKGTLVHAVLEHMHGQPREARTYPAVVKQLKPTWQSMLNDDPTGELAQLVPDRTLMEFLVECRGLLKGYFIMENPTGFDATEIEKFVQMTLRVDAHRSGGGATGGTAGADARETGDEATGGTVGVAARATGDEATGGTAGADARETGDEATVVPVRGFIDRVDIAPTGQVRIVDYKTGKKPHPRFQNEALFQMRFYALVWWRMTGRIPEQLRLMYLKVADDLTHSPTAPELERFEAELAGLWASIVRDGQFGDFRPKKSKLCGWCSFQELCPAFGGNPPEFPGWPGAHSG